MTFDAPEGEQWVAHPLGTALTIVSAAALLLMFLRSGAINSITEKYSRIRGEDGKADVRPASTQPATQPSTRPTVTASRAP
jgi:hypothetical protein